MRITKERVSSISTEIIKSLINDGFIIDIEHNLEKLEVMVSQTITEELRIEDDLNEEVRDIMMSHDEAINRGSVNYAIMFQMIKKKLIRERNIII